MSAMMRMREGHVACCGAGEADKYAASRNPPADVLESTPAPPALLHVRGGYDEALESTLEMLREQGGAVWEGLVSEAAIAEARQVRQHCQAPNAPNRDHRRPRRGLRHATCG